MVLLMLERNPMDDLKSFFNELKEQYCREKQNFPWTWDEVKDTTDLCKYDHRPKLEKDFVYYIAYNLGKNILHGPLPSHLHSRMIFDKNMWSERYVNFLEGK
jgi:hypothetical protein